MVWPPKRYLITSYWLSFCRASLVAQMVKHMSAMQETRVRSLGWEDTLEKEMATHSSTLPWKIPWMEELGRLQSMGLQRVGHGWATSLSLSIDILASGETGERDVLVRLIATLGGGKKAIDVEEVFPGGISGKDLFASAGDIRDVGFITGLGRSLKGGHGNTLQYSCLENPMDREAWQTTVHRVAQSETSEVT